MSIPNSAFIKKGIKEMLPIISRAEKITMLAELLAAYSRECDANTIANAFALKPDGFLLSLAKHFKDLAT